MFEFARQTPFQECINEFEVALDSLHTLPLSIMPLHTPGLRRATMIKNARLESVIEVFRDNEAGSGQIGLADIPNFFENHGAPLGRDIAMLEEIGGLQSFDVFTLRCELRRIDVGFEDFNVLSLSDSKTAELTAFMRDFTRPLITRIYGKGGDDGGDGVHDLSRIVGMLANPDRGVAIRRLKMLAAELSISIMEIPTFLKQYGDVFLSLSYFRQCVASLSEEIPELLYWMDEIGETSQVQSDPSTLRMMQAIRDDLTEIFGAISARFASFDDFSKTFWDDVSAESFRMFGATVTAQHVGIGAMLCGLTVKMLLWRDRFPSRAGLPTRRIEFLSSEIVPGLERIKTPRDSLEQAVAFD